MARKPAKEQGDTLAAISQAAFRLFGQHGYDGVSLSQVAKQAHITKAAIYWHFEDKTALFLHSVAHFYELLQSQVFAPLTHISDAAEQLLALFSHTAALLEHPLIKQGVAGFWLDSKTTDLSHALEIQRAFEQHALELLCAIFDRGQHQGVLKLSLPSEDMARSIIALLEASTLSLRSQTGEQTERLVRSLAHTLFCAYTDSKDLQQRALSGVI